MISPPIAVSGHYLRRDLTRHLPYFLVAAEVENFAEAAKLLRLTKAALSSRISNLEHEFGFRLFHRHHNAVLLTSEGRELLQVTKRIMEKLDSAIEHIRAMEAGATGQLTIGVIPAAAGLPTISAAIRKHYERYPRVRLLLMPRSTLDQTEAILAGQIDLAFLYNFRRDNGDLPEFVVRQLSLERLMLALPSGHRLATASAVTIADLRTENMLWPPRIIGGRLNDKLDIAFKRADIVPRIVLEASSNDILLNAVRTGLGIGFMNSAHVVPEDVTLRQLEGVNIELSLDMVRPTTSHNRKLIENFCECIDI